MRRNNGGYTLVELIVALAILAIVIVAAGGFIISGSNAYRTVSTNVNLQVESQLAMSQIKEFTIDCNGGLAFDGAADTLYVINRESDGSYSEHVFAFDGTDETLMYSKYTFTDDGAGSFTRSAAPVESGLMTRHVSGFAVSGTGGASTSSIAVAIDFSRMGRSYTGTETVALRNQPKSAADEGSLITAVIPA